MYNTKQTEIMEYSNINENEEVTTTATSTMSTEVDTIINSLETLASQLSEDLEKEDVEITEGFLKSWMISMQAAKAQKKINKIRMNSADLEFAAVNATGDKRDVLMAKSDAVKDQAAELQSLVDDRFAGKGAIVDKRISKEKIKGQLAIIKRTSGMEDNPDKKRDLRAKMQELNNKYSEERQAIKDLEDKNSDEIKKQKEKMAAGRETTYIEDSLITRAKSAGLNELATEIESKLDWQITEGTTLRSKYEAIVKRKESDNILNESRYQIDSIKDAFNKLM